MLSREPIHMDIVVISIIYFVLILAIVGVLIYQIVDFNKYKEKDAANLQGALAKVDAESSERKSNVNYVIQEANKMNKGMYDELKGDISDTKTELQHSLDRYGKAIKLVDPRVGTNTSTGTSSGAVGTDMPSNITPDVNLMSKVTAMNGMTVKDITKTDKLQLGDKFQFSGIGDAHANDDWLRMFNKAGTGYHGGIAMGKLWVGGATHLRGDVNIRGGRSEHNPGNWGTHFGYWSDLKNYIRGDTEIRGNTNNIGDLNIGRNANIQGRLHFKDPTMDTRPTSANNSDPYFIEKKVHSANNSELRITINDDPQERVTVFADSCRSGNCSGTGVQRHSFDAMGNATHGGSVTATKKTPNQWESAINIKASTDPTSLYSLHFGDGTDLHGRQAGMGYVQNQPNKIFGSRGTLASHIHGNDDWMLYSSGWTPLVSVKGGSGDSWVRGHMTVGTNMRVGRHIDANNDWGGKGTTLFTGWGSEKTVIGNWKTNAHDYALSKPGSTVVVTNPLHVQNQLCLGDVCITAADLNRIKTKTA
jgi:hypothetical protein